VSFVPLLLEGVGDGLVVGVDDEAARFQHMTEMFYGLVYGQQLEVVSAVFLLDRVEFLEEESEGLPGSFDTLLKYGIHGRRGDVSD
jgi:hypothetical protein